MDDDSYELEHLCSARCVQGQRVTALVAARLRNKEMIAEARQFPYQMYCGLEGHGQHGERTIRDQGCIAGCDGNLD
jgi:hypothetical protein